MKTDPHQIIRSCLADEQHAWHEFVHAFRPYFVAGLRRGLSYSGVAPRTEDIEGRIQDCYCRVLDRNRHVLRNCLHLEPEQIGAYLVQVGRSAALDWLRHRGAKKRGSDLTIEVEPEWLDGVGAQPADAERGLCARETLQHFWDDCTAVAGARGNSLEILWAAWVEQAPSREIADQMGMAVSSIDSVVCRMRKRMEGLGWRIAARAPRHDAA